MNIEQITEIIRVIGELIANNSTLIKIGETFAIAWFYGYRTFNSKYRLIRSNELSGSIVISNSEALRATRSTPKKQLQNKEIIDIINEAFEVLKNEVSEKTMQLIKRNLNSISEKSKKANPIRDYIYQHLLNYSGYYQSYSHSFKVLSKNNFRQIISHELMHAASSYSYNGENVVGFHQHNHNIGVGINEGYTDVISKRYFCKGIVTHKTAYSYLEAIAKIIELIVGKEKMQEFYFQSDLKGLISELSKYQDESKVKEFIFDLDTHYKVITSTKAEILLAPEQNNILYELYKKTNNFLLELYRNKIDKITNIQDFQKFNDKFSKLIDNAIYESNHTKKDEIILDVIKPLLVDITKIIRNKLIPFDYIKKGHGIINGYFSPSPSSLETNHPCYYHRLVAESIEYIIGSEKIKQIFQNQNITELINELSKYQDKEKVEEFISNLDKLYNIMYNPITKKPTNQNIIIELTNKIKTFLHSTCITKTEKNNNNVNNRMLPIIINEYIHSMDSYLTETLKKEAPHSK